MYDRLPSALPIVSAFAAFVDVMELFWIYVIIYKSSPDMKEYKWVLLKLAICDLFFNITISVLVIPDMLIPAPGAVVLGVMRYIGPKYGPFWAFSLCLWAGCAIYTALNDCVYTRSLFVYGKAETIQFAFSWLGALIALGINLVCFFFCSVGVYFALNDRQAAWDDCVRFLCTEYIKYYYEQTDSVIIMITITSVRGVILGIFLGVGLMIMHGGNFISSYLTLRKLRENRSSMSASTYQAQRQLIFMLVGQNIYPLIAVGTPVIATIISAVFRNPWFYDKLPDVILFLYVFALYAYPLFSCLFGLGFVKSHRLFILENVEKVLVDFPCYKRNSLIGAQPSLIEATTSSGNNVTTVA